MSITKSDVRLFLKSSIWIAEADITRVPVRSNIRWDGRAALRHSLLTRSCEARDWLDAGSGSGM